MNTRELWSLVAQSVERLAQGVSTPEDRKLIAEAMSADLERFNVLRRDAVSRVTPTDDSDRWPDTPPRFHDRGLRRSYTQASLFSLARELAVLREGIAQLLDQPEIANGIPSEGVVSAVARALGKEPL